LVRQGFADEAVALLAQAQRAQTDPAREAELARERARLLMDLGEAGEARTVLEEVRERHPEHPGLAVTLADALILQGRTAEARELVRFAPAFDPSGRLEKLLEARIYLKEGFPQWAMQVTGELAARGDQSVETRHLHARASSHAENWAEALRTYRALLAQAPEAEEARTEYAALLAALGDHRGASAQVAMLSPSRAEAPPLKYLRTKILLGDGDIGGARRMAAKLAAEQPESPVVLTLLGDVERAAGNLDAAVALYAQARELAPGAVEPLFAQTDTMRAQGVSLNQIIRVLEGHMAAQGESSVVLNQIAAYLLEAGDLPRASQRVQRSLVVEPNDWRTAVLQARIDRMQGDDAKASVQLEHAIRLSPRSPEPYNRLAEIYEARGEPDRAEGAYLRLLDVSPGEPQTCNNLATLYLEQGRFSEAVALARQALEGAPDNPAVLDTLGWALELSGRAGEAAGYLEAAYERLPDHPEVLLHWGVNLNSRGKTVQAGAILSRVVGEAPGTPVAARAAELLASWREERTR
jgi:tetratricopeptide (TPR) repeat protein